MKADFRVLLDACVLANFAVCDVLLRLAERPRLFLPVWSEQVLEEVRRTQVNKLGWPTEIADSFRREVGNAFPEARVSGYEHLIVRLTNEEGDRHVLAAAIHGGCPLILTFNLRHFAAESLKSWSIEAKHPQDYLMVLYDMEPKQVISRIGEIAGRRGVEPEDVLIHLGKSVPAFSRRLLDDLSG